MSDALRTAISGLNDSSLRVANATSNIVNASSTGKILPDGTDTAFHPQDVVTISNEVGGVTSTRIARDPATYPASDPQSPNANAQGLVAVPNVDIASEIVAIKVAQVVYEANAKLIKAVSDTQKKLIDTVA